MSFFLLLRVSIRKLAVSLLLLSTFEMLAFAAGTVTVHGNVVNSVGNLVPGATVTLTNALTHKATTATSDQQGEYKITAHDAGDATLTVTKEGFQTFSEDIHLSPGQVLYLDAPLTVGKSSQMITVHAGAMTGVTTTPSQDQVFASSQSIRVIDRKQMDMAGPVAGGAQIIATAPGALVTGYGNTGATKYTVTINGLNQGWGGYGGYTGGGTLGITFDGVPIVDSATQLWPSATIPETGMIQNTNVTYGPGAPADRWSTTMGGGVEFTPMQPTARPSGSVTTTYGSYQQKDIVANLSTGLIDGWSTVISGGAGKGDDFRKAPDGFKNPSKDWAVQAKTVKAAGGNSIELAGYYAYGGGYRSQVIPIAANPLITMDGTSGTAQYSQKTSGYYSTLPYASYNKYDVNQMGLVYAREHLQLDKTTTVQNLTWYMHIGRLHARYNDVYSQGARLMEYNDPYSNAIGDKFQITKVLPMNTVKGGGYYIHELYNTRQNFYNPADGGSKTTANEGGEVRSSYFNEDDFALFLQDDFHPLPMVHITPGIRYVGFAAGFSQNVAQDFNFAPGATMGNYCNYTQKGTAGTVKVQDTCPDAKENRSGVEPSIDAALEPLPWLSLYGGFQEALRAPGLGGGGGVFQAVDPASYHLERSTYTQVGFKIHTQGTGLKNGLLFGANYYHNKFANQEIDTTLANGDTFDANGSSHYNGVNIFVDDDPMHDLHVFANANIEAAKYDSYVTGGIFVNGAATCAGINKPGQPPVCVDYAGYPVSYVPKASLNAGVFYTLHPTQSISVEPTASFQYVGSQHLFDNCAYANGGCNSPAPSKTATMPSYATLNLGAKVPYKHLELSVMALNVLNNSHNIFEYISAGSYFGTAGNGPNGEGENYITGYPGAPVTAYGSVSVHF